MNKLFKRLLIISTTALLLVSGNLPVNSAEQQVLTIAKVESWLRGYEEAWETLDADKAIMLFTENATYQEEPYKDPFQGRKSIHEYWTAVTADQKDVDFTYEVISVMGNISTVHWHSEFIQPSSGTTIVLDGIFILEFSREGLCNNLKEWWHFKATPAKDN